MIDGTITIGAKREGADSIYLEELADKTFKVLFYFWVTKDGSAFLMNAKNDNVSIWQFTSEKKWRPVHNAKPQDGFDGIGHTILNTDFDPKTKILQTGDLAPKIEICLSFQVCE